MGWLSFQGRIGRAQFWLVYVLPVSVLSFGLDALGAAARANAPPDSALLTRLAILVLHLVLLWPSLAGTIKRLHDRNRSGLWAFSYWLFALLPVFAVLILAAGFGMGAVKQISAAGLGTVVMVMSVTYLVLSLWLFIELGCLRGTVGPNRYGPDPMNPYEAQPGQWNAPSAAEWSRRR